MCRRFNSAPAHSISCFGASSYGCLPFSVDGQKQAAYQNVPTFDIGPNIGCFEILIESHLIFRFTKPCLPLSKLILCFCKFLCGPTCRSKPPFVALPVNELVGCKKRYGLMIGIKEGFIAFLAIACV